MSSSVFTDDLGFDSPIAMVTMLEDPPMEFGDEPAPIIQEVLVPYSVPVPVVADSNSGLGFIDLELGLSDLIFEF